MIATLQSALPESESDPRRFRKNIIVVTDPPDRSDAGPDPHDGGHPEFDWVSRRLTIGEATCEVVTRISRYNMVSVPQADLSHDRAILSPSALDVVVPLTEPHKVFRGSARTAALKFSRTSNASVALALATLGLDRTEVIVVADPEVKRTRHVVEWESPLGSYEMRFENSLDPDSGGRTSAITAWSVAEVLISLSDGAGPGLVVLEGPAA